MSTPVIQHPIGSLQSLVAKGEAVPLVAPLRPDPVGPPPSNGGPQVFHAKDFLLESGVTLPELNIGYETWGTPNQFRSNVILLCHGRSGNRLSHGIYVGPGKLFDTDRYFVVAMDAIGSGLSSSPASSGLKMRFPHFTIRDSVRAHCLAATLGLGLGQLRCVAGPSMGSYAALEWAVNYPAILRSAVLLVPSAKSTPQQRAIHEAQRAAIMADPAWDGGDYGSPPVRGLRVAATAEFPWSYGEEWYLQFNSVDRYEARLEWTREQILQRDANNIIYTSLACNRHDVAEPYGGNLAAALARCRMPIMVMPCATDLLIPPRHAQLLRDLLPRATYQEIPSYAGHWGFQEADFVTHHVRAFFGEHGL
ncbi:MAG: alpha/beta fold hydrolase [Chloroflexota bacterium]|mgnify:CR=1 FL=1